MCIRDSCYSIQLYYDYEDLFENEWNQIVGDKIVSTKNSICLLYTSDAADERSSVDLGGRRIIKKKKHLKASGKYKLKR